MNSFAFPLLIFSFRLWRVAQRSFAALLMVSVIAALAGCANHSPAPIQERSVSRVNVSKAASSAAVSSKTGSAASDVRTGFYMVKAGDTLYSIALEHGQYYRDVAAWNNLEDAAVIKVGQVLRVSPPVLEGGATEASSVAVTAPVKLETVSANSAGFPATAVVKAPTNASSGSSFTNTTTYKEGPKGDKIVYSDQVYARMTGAAGAAMTATTAAKSAEPGKSENKVEGLIWIWPAAGKITEPFNESRNKGLDIAGRSGDAVSAASDGRVVYSGNGLRGYGNLVVVRHNADYSSVYAHNQKILVSEGQDVKRGQKIAEIGATDADQPKLHFEVRYQGKPVDPVKFLPER